MKFYIGLAYILTRYHMSLKIVSRIPVLLDFYKIFHHYSTILK